MLHHEFSNLMGYQTSEDEYVLANAVYNKTESYKQQFCAEWKKISKDMKNGIRGAINEEGEYWRAKFEKEWENASKSAQTHANKVEELMGRIKELEDELLEARNTIAEYMVKCDEVADINNADIDFVSTATMSVNYDIK